MKLICLLLILASCSLNAQDSLRIPTIAGVPKKQAATKDSLRLYHLQWRYWEKLSPNVSGDEYITVDSLPSRQDIIDRHIYTLMGRNVKYRIIYIKLKEVLPRWKKP